MTTAQTQTQTQTSRVIVKNLPKWSTEVSIKKHFSSKGQITDIKLMYTRSGVFRRFAFIGFSNPEDAAAAVKYFNRTFIDTSRIEVEFAFRAGSEELSRPWSKYSEGSSRNDEYLARKHQNQQEQIRKNIENSKDKLFEEMERKKKLLESIYGDDQESSKLRNFVGAMKSTSKTKIWENDGEQLNLNDKPTFKKKIQKNEIKVEAVPNRKPGGKGQLVTKTHVKFENDSDNLEGDEKFFESGSESDDYYEDFAKKEVETAQDGEEEGENVNLTKDPGSTNDTVIEQDHHQQKQQHQQQDQRELNAELITETGRLFVRNLSYTCTEDEVRRLFEVFGPINEVHLSISKETKKPKGFGYVLFMFPEHALRAYSELDGIIFQGRILHILPAKEKPSSPPNQEVKDSFKAKREKEQKANAQKDYNWNSLFIRSDTVLDAIAAKLGVKKSSIMDIQSENLATKLAVAETNLIQETKQYLENEGVLLDAFSSSSSSSVKRSDCIILVKNLPFETETNELRKIFEKFGSVGRVILPPTKAVGLVEFFESSEARTAFKNLAYSKFKHVPLFLEWAPIQALKPVENLGQSEVKKIISETPDEQDDELIDEVHGSNTLFIKNLNFSTTLDTLKSIFSAMGPLKSVKIATKKTNGKLLSLGFGFVEFERKETLNRTLDELQGTVVDGHALLLKRSSSSSSKADQQGKRKRSNNEEEGAFDSDSNNKKLIVRNIPFEASEKEVRELFKSFAQLKRVRLPRRYDGRHRGFGFIDFLTHQEAVNAFKSLSHTHLYGRHLVIEWAKPESGSDEVEAELEELREKTRKNMSASSSNTLEQSKKVKLDKSSNDDNIEVESFDDDDE